MLRSSREMASVNLAHTMPMPYWLALFSSMMVMFAYRRPAPRLHEPS